MDESLNWDNDDAIPDTPSPVFMRNYINPVRKKVISISSEDDSFLHQDNGSHSNHGNGNNSNLLKKKTMCNNNSLNGHCKPLSLPGQANFSSERAEAIRRKKSNEQLSPFKSKSNKHPGFVKSSTLVKSPIKPKFRKIEKNVDNSIDAPIKKRKTTTETTKYVIASNGSKPMRGKGIAWPSSSESSSEGEENSGSPVFSSKVLAKQSNKHHKTFAKCDKKYDMLSNLSTKRTKLHANCDKKYFESSNILSPCTSPVFVGQFYPQKVSPCNSGSSVASGNACPSGKLTCDFTNTSRNFTSISPKHSKLKNISSLSPVFSKSSMSGHSCKVKQKFQADSGSPEACLTLPVSPGLLSSANDLSCKLSKDSYRVKPKTNSKCSKKEPEVDSEDMDWDVSEDMVNSGCIHDFESMDFNEEIVHSDWMSPKHSNLSTNHLLQHKQSKNGVKTKSNNAKVKLVSSAVTNDVPHHKKSMRSKKKNEAVTTQESSSSSVFSPSLGAAISITPVIGSTENPIDVEDLTPQTKQAFKDIQQMQKDEHLARQLQEELDREFALSLQNQSTEDGAGVRRDHHCPQVHSGLGPAHQGVADDQHLGINPAHWHMYSPVRTRGARRRGTGGRRGNQMHEEFLELLQDTYLYTGFNTETDLNGIIPPTRRGGRRGRAGHTFNVMAGMFSPTGSGNDYESLMNLADMLGEVKDKGLTKSEMNRLPTVAYKKTTGSKTEEEAECNICMMNYEDGDSQKILPCFHAYHSTCIDKWIKKNRTCPVCRVEVNLN